MKVENGLIVSAKRSELWQKYLASDGIEEIMDFEEFIYRLTYYCGVQIEREE